MSEDVRKDGFYWPEVDGRPRKFRRVPRVMRCLDPIEGIVFAHPGDNPFVDGRETFKMFQATSIENRLIRWCGLALKMQSARFGRFHEKVHVIPDALVPKQGTNYHIIDPHPSRNFAMMWVRCVKGADHYVYREWPGTSRGQKSEVRGQRSEVRSQRSEVRGHGSEVSESPAEVSWQITGIGDPGPWTENDAKRPDGKAGPAQRKFNFGLLDYKREIARLEGWKDYRDARAANWDWSKCKTISQWSAYHGCEEEIFRRIIDSRGASAPRVENDRPTTLHTDLLDIGLDCELAPGEDYVSSDGKIDSALAYDTELFNKTGKTDYATGPHLWVAESCVNTIYMFENFTGLEENGATDYDSACKEWADLLRYYLMSEPVDIQKGSRKARPGVYF